MERELIFKKDSLNDNGYFAAPRLPSRDLKDFLPAELLRADLEIPSPGELEVVRHFMNLARLNFSVDTNFYPLGSCTMKYNPKINEELAALEAFTDLHPYQNGFFTQGALELIYNLEALLKELCGMKRFSFQPSSGAQGELTGILMIKKYHEHQGSLKTKVLIPDSAHGTNPASAAMCGYQTVVIPSNKDGCLDLERLSAALDGEVAALMLTNPNTLGVFEENILKISQAVHEKGGLLYYDGANFNPLLGITQPSLMGFDVIHLNLHKTFATPHGSGGPGVGAVGVNEKLVDFLPYPLVDKKQGSFFLNYNIKHSIGRVRAFYGNFMVLLRAYAYLLRLGRQGVKRVAQMAVLNANYIRVKLKENYQLSSLKPNLHEVVFSCSNQKERGAACFDIAKRLIDYGIHPPTMYFPLIVKEALMIEPTETESKQTLDRFIKALLEIDAEITQTPQNLKDAPLKAAVKRVDETQAARNPNLAWSPED